MNKARREAITKLADQLDAIRGEIEALRDEEQEYFNNMPESLQGGDKGQAAEQAVASLDDAINEIESALDSLNSAGV